MRIPVSQKTFVSASRYARHLLLAILISLVVTSVFLLFIQANPLEVFRSLVLGVLTRRYGLGESLVKATPLILIGLGFSVAFKAGLTNLGGDGQLVMGAAGATLVATSFQGIPVWIHFLLIAAGAMAAGAVWGGIAGYFKGRFNTNEIIMTIMMNYIALYFVSFLVDGPMKDPAGLLPHSKMVPAHLMLPKILSGTRAHIGILLAVGVAVLVYVLVNRSVFGFKFRALGHSPAAARYAGIDNARYRFLALAIAGSLSGLAGMFQVTGVTYRLLDGMAGGVGFTAIVVAILGRLNPFGIVVAALFIGALESGGNSVQAQMGVPVSIVEVLSGVLIYFVVISYYTQKRKRVPACRFKLKGGETHE